MKNAQLQYNGTILLYGYLQRVFVYRNVGSMLGETPEILSLPTLQNYLDGVSKAMQEFDPNTGLTENQQRIFLSTLEAIREPVFLTVKTEEDLAVENKLATVAAALYADDYINAGLIHLGNIFDKQIAERFQKHVFHFKNRVNLISRLVEKAAGKQPLTEEESSQLDALNKDIRENSSHIETDLETIKHYLKGVKPEAIK